MSRLEDEKEEKLGEGIWLLYGSGAGAAVGCEFCAALSLILMFPSPSGHPFVASVS